MIGNGDRIVICRVGVAEREEQAFVREPPHESGETHGKALQDTRGILNTNGKPNCQFSVNSNDD